MTSHQNTKQLQTPILFLGFNRPEQTRQVFQAIRAQKPKQLYLAFDGPRDDHPNDQEKTAQARGVISKIDWDCDVHTLLREKNLGCKQAVSSAIDWFFDHVEEGIILEDDCLPNESFFKFCQLMLKKYCHDERVMMIGGTNYLVKAKIPESYFFSRYFAIWGWATWKRAWKLYDIKMKDWPFYRDNNYLKYLFSDRRAKIHYTNSFQRAYLGKVDTWDTQWNYTCIFNHGLSIVPRYNLITNIGSIGTHTGKSAVGAYDDGSGFVGMPTQDLDLDNLTHPPTVAPHAACDQKIFRTVFGATVNYQTLLKISLEKLGLLHYAKRILHHNL